MAKNDYPWIDPYYHTIKPANNGGPKVKYSKTTVEDCTYMDDKRGGVDSRPLKQGKPAKYDRQCNG